SERFVVILEEHLEVTEVGVLVGRVADLDRAADDLGDRERVGVAGHAQRGLAGAAMCVAPGPTRGSLLALRVLLPSSSSASPAPRTTQVIGESGRCTGMPVSACTRSVKPRSRQPPPAST